jgi:hypothetical protein
MSQSNRSSPPSPASPRRRVKPSATRVFSLDEATRALPYVRRIAVDLVHASSDAESRQEELKEMSAGALRTAAEADLKLMVDRLHRLTTELQQVGVELRDHMQGAVDFPTEREGKRAFLSWQLGEESIAFFREADDHSFTRKPL